MPNWTFNTIEATGDKDKIAELIAQAGKITPESIDSGNDPEHIYFGNFIPKPQEVIDSGDWYHWNIDNWETKWDACETNLESASPTLVTFTFTTAWSPPTPIFSAVAEQYPELKFFISYEGEEGWGGEYESTSDGTGNLKVVREWDIPDSHTEYANLDRVDSCVCSWDDDPTEWYEDCPKDGVVSEFEVEITRTVKVVALNGTHAIDVVEEALTEVQPIERRANGVADPFEVTEFDNGVVVELANGELVS